MEPEGREGEEGKGFTVTLAHEGAEEPQRLSAETQTCAVPLKAAFQVMVPVVPVPATEFPAPLTVHRYEEAPEAEAAKKSLPGPWQREETPEGTEGAGGCEFTVTLEQTWLEAPQSP